MRRPIVTKIIFPVTDMAASIDFYERLGFEVVSYDDGYAWVKHAGEELFHLALASEMDPLGNHAAGYFHVIGVDEWHRRCAPVGAEVTTVELKPWGLREFSLRDPDRNLLRLGEPPD